MTGPPTPLCQMCAHRHDIDGWACDAFPDGIPAEILESIKDHREEVFGDGGIRFDPIDAEAAAWAERLFAGAIP